MLALVLIPLAVIAIQAWLWRRELRLRSSPEWRKDRLVSFVAGHDLPSTCSMVGHEIGDYGCEWCDDLVPMWAYQTETVEGKHYLLDPASDDVRIVRAIDRRFVSFQQLGWRWGKIEKTQAGIAWVDRSKPKDSAFADDLPATSLAEQARPEYNPMHGNQAPQAPPQGGSHRPEPGAPSREAQERFRAAFKQPYTGLGQAPSNF